MGLNEARIVPAVAVSDVAKAKEFYEGTLGLSNGEEQPDGGTEYPLGGGTSVHVYPSPDNAGSSGATLAYFGVEDVPAAVDELIGKGVTFEQYDMEGLKTDEKGIAELGEKNVTPEVLHKAGLARKSDLIKILGNGDLKSAVTVHGHKFSKTAAEKIAKAGGKAEVIA